MPPNVYHLISVITTTTTPTSNVVCGFELKWLKTVLHTYRYIPELKAKNTIATMTMYVAFQ